jgi:glutaredoxin-like protein NrdH
MDVTIFTGPGCTRCEKAKAIMTERGVSFVERSLAGDPGAMEELMALGARMLPVIRIGGEVISGFDPVKLGALLNL